MLRTGLEGGEDRGGEGVDGRDDERAGETVPATEADVPELDDGIPEADAEAELGSAVDPGLGPAPGLSVEPAETPAETPLEEPTPFT
ncbi:MAG: hypothetical protein ACJ786_34420 [Catenulispora sp.]